MDMLLVGVITKLYVSPQMVVQLGIYKGSMKDFILVVYTSVFVNNTGKGWAVGYSGEIFVTEDNGNSWAHILTGSGPTQDQINSVFFINENIGWAAGRKILIE